MSQATVRSGFDSWVGKTKPSANHNGEKYLRMSADTTDTADTLLYFRSPVPKGATVISATLRVAAHGASSGSRILSVLRVTESWKAQGVKWNNSPAAVSVSGASASIGTLADGDTVDINVAPIVQSWANGTANYGLKVRTDATTAHWLRGFGAVASKPMLIVEWSQAPRTPTNLRPADGAVPVAKPIVSFDFTDTSGDKSLGAIQVQIDPSRNASSPAFDSGTVATTTPALDLSTTSYAGLAVGATTYWRVRAQDGAGLWSAWSAWSSFSRQNMNTVAITNVSGGVVYDVTPEIIWSTTGGTQTSWRLFVYKAGTTTTVYDSGHRSGTDTSLTIPAGKLKMNKSYEIHVRSWDDVDRAETSGQPAYAFAIATVSVAEDTTVNAVTGLAANPVDLTPWVDLTWNRNTTPDAWNVYQNDDEIVLTGIDPADTFVSGTSYKLRVYTANPNRNNDFYVRPVVNGKQGPKGPVASITPSPSGIWIVDRDRGVNVTLWGDDPGTWAMTEDATVYTPLGASQVVRIVHGMQGYSGTITGRLADGFGKTYEAMIADLYQIKGAPTQTVRIIAGDENFEALVGNIQIAPAPDTREGIGLRNVSFDFWQVGDLPFDTP